MRALLLAAGLGTRLRPLTNTIPKCLVPIKGKPLLHIWLEQLTAANIGPFLINTHYLADQVALFVNNSDYRESITIVHEKKLRGTAGTLIDHLSFFGNDDGMLIHADNYSQADLNAFKAAHVNRPKICLMTMMVFETDFPSECGVVVLNEEIVVEFYEKVKTPPSNLANGAIYILSPEMIQILSENFNNATDFSTQIIQHFLGRIYVYKTKEKFIDIGTPQNYQKAAVE